MIKVGSDFSGVGAFDQALKRLGINYETIFACDMDKYARQTFIENYGEPKYYPENVYNREIPKESIDIYMTSPPCQAFSLAGNRKGESEERGVLFYNSHEFILKNKPRYFIFENVKGLLSDDSGKTFQRWIDYLSKSVNGQPVIFPHEESANYHVYHKVLNSKDYGVPQNRERIFIIGIRDDADNNFIFPPKEHLTKRLKDVLENDVDEKYFLSENAINRICYNESGFKSDPKKEDDIASTICASDYKLARGMNVLEVKSATKRGFETAKEGDSINFSQPNSETRRGRVGKEVAQTLDTQCNQGVISVVCFGRSEAEKLRRKLHFQATGKDSGSFKDKELILKNQEYYDTLLASPNPQKEGLISLDYKIRRLTPRECFRLQDFPETFKMPCSDSQMYKQAGNSITVGVLEKIIKRLIKI
jgi:DNA (cytosine-5)-methyltransferase 1